MRRSGFIQRCALLGLTIGSLSVGCGDRSDGDESVEQSAQEQAEESFANGVAGRITAIAGPGGVLSPGMAEGTFLGKGARLDAGQVVETPKGTLAEFELDSGGRVRLNESTAVGLPGEDHPTEVVVTRGEAVIVLDGKSSDPLKVAAGDEHVEVQDGEVLIRNSGERRQYSVVHGHAVVTSGDQKVELDAGESIDGPLLPPQTEEPREPLMSLRPLDDTDWSRTFDAAAQMADEVPRGVGSLTARRAGSKKERQSLRLTDHQVTVNIAGRIAHTEVEQAFFNDKPAVLEGIYRFPMPGDASVSGLSLLVGNTWMDGEIVEKQRGRQIFQQIVDATIPRDPALLEWERGSVFKLRIFPIPGRGERRIKLSYTQVLPVVGGKLRYRYPLGGTGATDVPIDHFAFTMNVDGRDLSEAQLSEMTTPMLALDRTTRDGVVSLSTEREKFLPTFDLGVDVPVPESSRNVHTATHLDQDGQAYFMVTVQPELELERKDAPVHYAFVLDRSHSTTPQLWTVGRGIVDAMTEMMDADDRFTVLACDTACDEHPDGLQAPDPGVVGRAQRFLDDQDLAGASDLGGMLVQAKEALDRGDAGAQRVVVYLGDGAPTSGEMAADALVPLVKRPLQDTRVMAVALGSRSDLTTLGAVVESTGGDLVRVDARDDLRVLVRELRLRAEVPAVRDVKFDLPPGMTSVRTQNAASLRSGDAVILAGKLRHPIDGDVVMRAQGPTGPVEQRFAISMNPAPRGKDTTGVSAHLPRTWAAMQIQHLTKTEGFDAKEEIVGLSKDYNVMSRFTSLIVLENDRMFREFNVVRKSKNKDTWKGDLEESNEQSDKPTSSSTPTPAGDETAEAKPKEELQTELRRRGAPATGADENLAPLGGIEEDPADAGEKSGELGLIGGRTAGNAGSGSAAGFGKGGAARDERKDAPFSPPAEPRAQPAPEPEPPALLEDEDDDGGFAEPAKKADRKSASRPRPAPKPSKPKKKKKSVNPLGGAATDDPFIGPGSGWGGGGSRRPPSRRRWQPRPLVLKVREFPGSSSKTLASVERLRTRVQANPTQRSLHSQLVRTAMRAGHPQTTEFARAWAEVDPDHSGALRSLADTLAQSGDPLALRAYESVLEVRPFSDDAHEQLAAAYENKGDLRRSCSHRRAVVSIDPAKVDHQAKLMACLRKEGRRTDADDVRETFLTRSSGSGARVDKLGEQLEKEAAKASIALHRGAQLKATLTWAGEDDLDIAIVDRRGRRLSTMRPEKGIRVLEGRGSESVTMSRVSGSVFIEVTRNRPPHGGSAGVNSAVLEVKTGGKTRRINVSLVDGSTRVAKVFWGR